MGVNIWVKFREKATDLNMKKMGQYTLGTGKTIWKMDSEKWNFKTIMFIKEIGKMIWWMVKENISIKMGTFIQEISSKTREKEKVN